MLFGSSVDARQGGGGFSGGGGGHSIGRSAPRMSHPGASAPRPLVHSSQRARNGSTSNKAQRQDQHKKAAAGKAARPANRSASAAPRQVQQKRIGAEQKSGSRALQPGQAAGKNALRNLPMSKAVAGTARHSHQSSSNCILPTTLALRSTSLAKSLLWGRRGRDWVSHDS